MVNEQTPLILSTDSSSYDVVKVPQVPQKSLRLLSWKSRITGVLLLLVLVVPYLTYRALHPPGYQLPAVPDLIRVRSLTPQDAPNYATGRRLIIVGDVHGKLHELNRLVTKISFDPARDRLVLLGDMISKGPHSLQVLDYAISVNALCVRGNHASAALTYYAELHGLPAPKIRPPHKGQSDNNSEQTLLSNDNATEEPLANIQNKANDKLISRLLQPHHVEYIGTCPAIMDLGAVGFNGTNAVAVHGGLQWNITSLEDQDPRVVFTIRSYAPPDYSQPLESAEGKSWSIVWNEKQYEKPLDDRLTVFYGHHSSNGLQMRDYSAGIDTGCYGGGRLTAIVIAQTEAGELTHTLETVPCSETH
ncbi:hypothetical protein D0Z00_000117 [Geotrichum galactomycetum]|uniref:Uncharacterized protein n=1 Tax=Geotrichum galactomycetum TaxID=27317 RepID=A0ACB6VAG7_9ASCO|nr:hypothetical protein D0Z00_000117 [Geotrichum candidum]